MEERIYTSRRYSILLALVEQLKTINGLGEMRSNVYNEVHPKLAFFDEVENFPSIYCGLGRETREYQGGGFKDRFLNIVVRAYIKEPNPQQALERLLEDLETVIEQNGRLAYQDSSGAVQKTIDIKVIDIDTDEGALDPLAAGEINLLVQY